MSVCLCVFALCSSTLNEVCFATSLSALDADLRFALKGHPRNDIIRRCLVYIHEVVNAKGEQEKGQMSSKLQPQSEAGLTHRHLLIYPATQ